MQGGGRRRSGGYGAVLSQTGSSACLKKAFCKTCVTIALRNPDDFILVQAEESVDSQKFHRV